MTLFSMKRGIVKTAYWVLFSFSLAVTLPHSVAWALSPQGTTATVPLATPPSSPSTAVVASASVAAMAPLTTDAFALGDAPDAPLLPRLRSLPVEAPPHAAPARALLALANPTSALSHAVVQTPKKAVAVLAVPTKPVAHKVAVTKPHAPAAKPLVAAPLSAEAATLEREAQRRKAVVQYLGQLPDEQVLDFYRVNQRVTVLKTLHYEVLKQGSFLVNNQEVFRFRSGLGFLTPYLRAKQAAHRLQALLRNKATYLDVAVAQTAEGLYTINVGPSVVTTVDAKTAEYQGLQPQVLAELWKQKLRVALGEKPPTALATAVSNQVSGLAQSVQQQGVKLAEGMASWYGPGFHGRRCADGSRFDMHGLTAAHRTLPFGTKLRVVNMRTGKSCVVRVTDRGPFSGHRILDLSKGAAAAIGMLSSGVAKVRLERLP